MKKVTVILINWNGRRYLQACLESLHGQSFRDFGVVLVDNASSDDSVDLAKKIYPGIEIKRLDKNFGFARAANYGITNVKTPYLALLNPDIELHRDWLTELVEIAEQRREIAIFASKILDLSDRDIIFSAGDYYTRSGRPGSVGYGEKDRGQYDSPGLVFGACGGASFYRRILFEKVGLFDEDFFMWFEDIDISFRALLLGYQCLYVPGAVVYHAGGGLSLNMDSKKSYHFSRNICQIFFKNMPRYLLWTNLPVFLLGQVRDALHYARLRLFKSFIKGKIDFILNLRETLEKRMDIQAGRKMPLSLLRSKLR